GGGRISGRARYIVDRGAQARRPRARARARGAGGPQAGRARGRRSDRAACRGRRGRQRGARAAPRLRDERDAGEPLAAPGGRARVRRGWDRVSAFSGPPASEGRCRARAMSHRNWFGLRGGATAWRWVSLIGIVLDQLTKYLIASNFSEFDEVVLLPMLSLVR